MTASSATRTPLRAISLMYHDVVEQESVDASGFPGRGPARYKLDWTLFDRHLGAIAAAGGKPASNTPPSTVCALPTGVA